MSWHIHTKGKSIDIFKGDAAGIQWTQIMKKWLRELKGSYSHWPLQSRDVNPTLNLSDGEDFTQQYDSPIIKTLKIIETLHENKYGAKVPSSKLAVVRDVWVCDFFFRCAVYMPLYAITFALHIFVSFIYVLINRSFINLLKRLPRSTFRSRINSSWLYSSGFLFFKASQDLN